MSVRRGVSFVAVAAAAVLGTSACSVSSGSGGSSSSAGGRGAPSVSSSQPGAAMPSSGSSPDSGGSTSAPSTDSGSDSAGGSDASLVTGKVGEEVKSKKLSVKVSKVVDPVPVDTSSVFTPDAGKRWVAVNMTVTNLDTAPVTFSPSLCVDAKTDKNTTAETSLMANYGSPFSSAALTKGDTSTGDIVFEVQQGEKIKQLDIGCMDFSANKQTIRINLN